MRTRTLLTTAAAAVLAVPSAAQAHVTAKPPAVAAPTAHQSGPRAQAAHTGVVRRTPAPGRAHRTVRTVSATFSQKLVTGRIDVYRSGARVAPARSGPRGTSVTASFSRALARGAYTVKWRAVASDGHVQSGSWSFRVR